MVTEKHCSMVQKRWLRIGTQEERVKRMKQKALSRLMSDIFGSKIQNQIRKKATKKTSQLLLMPPMLCLLSQKMGGPRE